MKADKCSISASNKYQYIKRKKLDFYKAFNKDIVVFIISYFHVKNYQKGIVRKYPNLKKKAEINKGKGQYILVHFEVLLS